MDGVKRHEVHPGWAGPTADAAVRRRVPSGEEHTSAKAQQLLSTAVWSSGHATDGRLPTEIRPGRWAGQCRWKKDRAVRVRRCPGDGAQQSAEGMKDRAGRARLPNKSLWSLNLDLSAGRRTPVVPSLRRQARGPGSRPPVVVGGFRGGSGGGLVWSTGRPGAEMGQPKSEQYEAGP